MAFVGGIFENATVRDTRGRTSNVVSGYGNTVRFVGDRGANSFTIRGGAQNVTIHNLGGDDRVYLQGDGWREVRDCKPRDGVVRYYNARTKSYAEVHTDAGRNDNFVRNRVSYERGPSCGPWNNMGRLNHGQAAAYAQGFANGYRHGYADGYRRGWPLNPFRSFGNFLAMSTLGPMAWFCC